MGAGFVERFGDWTPARAATAAEVAKRVGQEDIKVIRLSFVDQHGLLRGKTIAAGEFDRVMRDGCGAPSSLLLKDTANRTVIPTFAEGGGVGLAEMQGASDLIMVPDPSTFKVLPWAPGTGWMLCDIRFTNGGAVPFSTRDILRTALGRLQTQGYHFVAGAELEFHLFRLVDPRLEPDDCVQPPRPPDVAMATQGYQYLWEARADELDDIYQALREGLQGLGLPLGTLEVEYGPSQCELTFGPQSGLAAADLVVLARSAVKQIARRRGYHATFMCRPKVANAVASGWHLHQSLQSGDGGNAFRAGAPGDLLSPVGRRYLAGLLAHARGAASFTAPTVNGYRRYREFSLAPDRVLWGRDNRGAMIRLAGEPGAASTRLENRIGDPAANPYLYLASQIFAGLDGMARDLDPGPGCDLPYETAAPLLPRSLDEALAALEADDYLLQSMGAAFSRYWLAIKRAELARFHAVVTEWEHREYFSIF